MSRYWTRLVAVALSAGILLESARAEPLLFSPSTPVSQHSTLITQAIVPFLGLSFLHPNFPMGPKHSGTLKEMGYLAHWEITDIQKNSRTRNNYTRENQEQFAKRYHPALMWTVTKIMGGSMIAVPTLMMLLSRPLYGALAEIVFIPLAVISFVIARWKDKRYRLLQRNMQLLEEIRLSATTVAGVTTWNWVKDGAHEYVGGSKQDTTEVASMVNALPSRAHLEALAIVVWEEIYHRWGWKKERKAKEHAQRTTRRWLKALKLKDDNFLREILIELITQSGRSGKIEARFVPDKRPRSTVQSLFESPGVSAPPADMKPLLHSMIYRLRPTTPFLSRILMWIFYSIPITYWLIFHPNRDLPPWLEISRKLRLRMDNDRLRKPQQENPNPCGLIPWLTAQVLMRTRILGWSDWAAVTLVVTLETILFGSIGSGLLGSVLANQINLGPMGTLIAYGTSSLLSGWLFVRSHGKGPQYRWDPLNEKLVEPNPDEKADRGFLIRLSLQLRLWFLGELLLCVQSSYPVLIGILLASVVEWVCHQNRPLLSPRRRAKVHEMPIRPEAPAPRVVATSA